MHHLAAQQRRCPQQDAGTDNQSDASGTAVSQSLHWAAAAQTHPLESPQLRGKVPSHILLLSFSWSHLQTQLMERAEAGLGEAAAYLLLRPKWASHKQQSSDELIMLFSSISWIWTSHLPAKASNSQGDSDIKRHQEGVKAQRRMTLD